MKITTKKLANGNYFVIVTYKKYSVFAEDKDINKASKRALDLGFALFAEDYYGLF